jgi:hypothetical protein
MKFIKLYNLIMENVLGIVEDIYIEGIGTIKAKTDTGNTAHNVLHGLILGKDNNKVKFETVGGKILVLPYEEEIKIHIGSGNKEDRPVVRFNVSINGKSHEGVPFSIADRSENEHKVLLGEDFIKNNGGIINVNKED